MERKDRNTDLERLTKLPQVGCQFVHLILKERLLLLRQALFLIRHKVAERRQWIRRRLSLPQQGVIVSNLSVSTDHR
jgi:hypothetical protein